MPPPPSPMLGYSVDHRRSRHYYGRGACLGMWEHRLQWNLLWMSLVYACLFFVCVCCHSSFGGIAFAFLSLEFIPIADSMWGFFVDFRNHVYTGVYSVTLHFPLCYFFHWMYNHRTLLMMSPFYAAFLSYLFLGEPWLCVEYVGAALSIVGEIWETPSSLSCLLLRYCRGDSLIATIWGA